MEFLREVIDSRKLDKVLTLPHSLHDRKVEILVFPFRDQGKKANISREKISELMEGSITQSLIGAVPHPDITLDEIHSLRLRKYDGTC